MSKEMIEPTEFQRGFSAGYDEAMRIRDALRASAVAEPVTRLHRTIRYVLDHDEGLSQFAIDELTLALDLTGYDSDAHPAPAAPVPASVREALALELASYDSIISAAKSDEALSDTGRRRIIECATDAKGAVKQFARHLAALPAPEAAPTREEPSFTNLDDMLAYLNDEPVSEPTREEIAKIIEQHVPHDEALSMADAILALKAAPAK